MFTVLFGKTSNPKEPHNRLNISDIASTAMALRQCAQAVEVKLLIVRHLQNNLPEKILVDYYINN